ncbi:MAG TPA: bifunctional 3,4-dihydroxy-2-butanone-4-phosphate synthase/GTP cyclohydrolase II [Thermoanaerobaculia bacterium]
MTERDAVSFASIDQAVEALREGRFVVVVDDEDRENEGDLVLAAEKVTPQAINFMAREGRGLICLALTEERCLELQLPPMVEDNTSNFGTAFTVSIEARGRTTTGISAADRAATVLTAIDPAAKPSDLNRPGHMFPLRAQRGGVLKRAGQTEASVDLARIAGLNPSAVLCEVMNEDGTMARVPDLVKFCQHHDFLMVTVADLIRYRMKNERLVQRIASPQLPTRMGEFRLFAYRSDVTHEEHLALVLGEIREEEPVLVRVHSQCLTGDVFGSARCDCGEQLELAMEKIVQAGKGVFLYLLQEGRGIGLINKLRAYELQDQGHDTVSANEKLGFPPDIRNYGVGCQILRDVGVRKMRLMTNNPSKYVAIDGYGLEIVERVPLEVHPTERSRKYLEAKKNKMGHLLKLV